MAEPDAPTLDGIAVSDGAVTLSFTAVSEADIIYARWKRNSPTYPWQDRIETFKRTGSGDITVSGVSNGMEYEFSGQPFDGILYGDFSNTRFAMPDNDAFAVSRYREKIRERDGRAKATKQVAQRRGVKVTFKNGPDADAIVYAEVDTPSTTTIGVRTGQIDRSDIIIDVPRQTNFPP